jgi:hypothetical protein
MKMGKNYDDKDKNYDIKTFLAQPSHFIQFYNIIPRNFRFCKGILKNFWGNKRPPRAEKRRTVEKPKDIWRRGEQSTSKDNPPAGRRDTLPTTNKQFGFLLAQE